MYECKRCGYDTSQRHALIKHYNRKVICRPLKNDIPIEDLFAELKTVSESCKCTECDKVFTTKSNLYRHTRICNTRKTNAIHNKIASLEQALVLLQNSKDAAPTTSTTIQNANTIQNIQNNIHINGIGKEDISYITDQPRFKRYMIRCLQDKMEGLCDYMVRKHFSPDHPENHNIRKLNKKDEFMDCYDGRKWRIKLTKKVLDEIFKNIEKEFTAFVDQAITEEGTIQKEWLDGFMREVGLPLEWDFTGDDYDFEEDMPDEEKERLKTQMYGLACEYIYRHSKVHRADGAIVE